MIESMRTRWIIIILVVTMSFLYFLPNAAKLGPDWPFSTKKLTYGLDIQGGVQLVLGVDSTSVIDEKMTRLGAQLTDYLKTQKSIEGVEAKFVSEEKHINLTVAKPEDVAKVQEAVKVDYASLLNISGVAGNVVTVRYIEGAMTAERKAVIDQAIEVIRNRIDEFGVSEPSISAQGSDRILVQLPGIKDSETAKKLINQTARLTFMPVFVKDGWDLGAQRAKLDTLISEAEKKGDYALGQKDLRYREYLAKLNTDLKGKIPEGTKVVFEKAGNAQTLEAGKVPYLVESTHTLSGDQLDDAHVGRDTYGNPIVNIRFDVEGTRDFAKMSGDNVGNLVAIVLDDIVQSAPRINERISGGSAQITLGQMNFEETFKEAQFLSTALSAGSLPVALTQLEERTVGPTLGADSIRAGQFAGLIAISLVFIFMLVIYGQLGMVANLAILLNTLMTIGILSSFGATLTLPGVAGLVLNVGMAVDANVIIYERIKELFKKGVNGETAVREGFNNALSSIIDSNVTNAAACVILIYLGTGPIRGFGVTLLIGVITSMFTTVFFSKTLIDMLARRKKPYQFA